MQVRTLLLLIVLGALALFAALNWGSFMAPTTLSLAFTTITAPLGLIMLGFVATITALFLAFVIYLQGTVLVDARRHAKELHAQRELADKAEASRFSELRTYMESQFAATAEREELAIQRLEARIDRLDRDFGAAIERTEASMAAYLGELDNRLGGERSAPSA